MAIRRDLAGPKPVAYYEKPWHRLEWRDITAPESQAEYWEVWYHGKHVGEFFEGKSRRWFGLVFGRTTIWGPGKDDILNMVTALVLGPRV